MARAVQVTRIVAISNTANPAELLQQAQSEGYIAFMYEHADPKHELIPHKFMYIRTDEELKEKVALLRADVTVVDEVARW